MILHKKKGYKIKQNINSLIRYIHVKDLAKRERRRGALLPFLSLEKCSESVPAHTFVSIFHVFILIASGLAFTSPTLLFYFLCEYNKDNLGTRKLHVFPNVENYLFTFQTLPY